MEPEAPPLETPLLDTDDDGRRDGRADLGPPPSLSLPPRPDAPLRPDDSPSPPPHDDGVDASRLPQIRWWLVVPAAALAVLAFYRLHQMGAGPRTARKEALEAESAAYDPRPTVEVVKPKPGVGAFELRLPADVDAMQETALFARTTGYLKKVAVDLGDRVALLQPLAEIDTPEVDAQVVSANASVAVAKTAVAKSRADLALAESTLRRFASAAQSGGVAAQDLDEKRSAVAQAKATLASTEAGVALAEAEAKRLATLQEFEVVKAPFAGVVTARGYDVGALVGPSATTPLYRLVRTDVLRVWVNVPQANVAAAKKDAQGFLTVRNRPGREFAAVLTRTTGALDPTTHTLRCQFEVPNPDGALLPGMFGELRLPVTAENPTLTVPTSAPTFGASGPTVWVVESRRVIGRKVLLGRDFGSEIEVVSGISPADDVVRNPGERLIDGIEVTVVTPPASPATPSPPAKKAPPATAPPSATKPPLSTNPPSATKPAPPPR